MLPFPGLEGEIIKASKKDSPLELAAPIPDQVFDTAGSIAPGSSQSRSCITTNPSTPNGNSKGNMEHCATFTTPSLVACVGPRSAEALIAPTHSSTLPSIEEDEAETSFSPSLLSTGPQCNPPDLSQGFRFVSMPPSVHHNAVKESTFDFPMSSKKTRRRAVSDNIATARQHIDAEPEFFYNDYGELLKRDRPMFKASELGVKETLRLVHKAYSYNFTLKVKDIITAEVEHAGKKVPGYNVLGTKNRLSSWDLVTPAPSDFLEYSPAMENTSSVTVYKGPPRVLEIGCADGDWCFKMKMDHPEWIIEGLDDSDRWSAVHPDVRFKDFMDFSITTDPNDYFSKVHRIQENPEFNVRDINDIDFPIPIPHNLYNFVRGRDIFGRVTNFRQFLDTVRLIVQPDGVVEFMEVDPRPRISTLTTTSEDMSHKSGVGIDWGEDIASRFRKPQDTQLNTGIPQWEKRVQERIDAGLRPKDGVPAAALKAWVQGAGFWDVTELILRLEIGGKTEAGQHLLEEMIRQVDLENQIPLLVAQLPKVDLQAIVAGSDKEFYVNLHIVTGRKPKLPRPGDLLLDGSRMEMTASKYETMARYNDPKSNHWIRYHYENEMMLDCGKP